MTLDEALLLPVGTPLFHCHHDELFEHATEPVVHRWDYINARKDPAEVPIRLHLLRPVLGTLPQAITDAWATHNAALTAYNAALTAYYVARPAYYAARAAYDAAIAEHADEIAALHAAECPDCPWDGHTIFPEGTP